MDWTWGEGGWGFVAIWLQANVVIKRHKNKADTNIFFIYLLQFQMKYQKH